MAWDWEVVASVAAAVGAVAAALVKLVPAVRMGFRRLFAPARRADDRVGALIALDISLRSMRRTAAVKLVLEQMVIRKGCQRALLLSASNSGEAWRSGGVLYVSNSAQVTAAKELNTQDLWQQWRVDGWYSHLLSMLLESYESKRGVLLFADATEGELRRQYEAQGTVASVVLPFMWDTGGVLWYVSFNYGRVGAKDETTTAQHRANAEELYDNPARCRAVIDALRAAYNSVR